MLKYKLYLHFIYIISVDINLKNVYFENNKNFLIFLTMHPLAYCYLKLLSKLYYMVRVIIKNNVKHSAIILFVYFALGIAN
jgi:hypothetical protein